MLVIRKEQMEALENYAREKFKDRMFQHVKELIQQDPEKHGQMDDEEIRDLVQKGIEKAESYNIESEQYIEGYIDLMVEIDPDFDEQEDMAWARSILDNEKLSEGAKINFIRQQLSEQEESADQTSDSELTNLDDTSPDQ